MFSFMFYICSYDTLSHWNIIINLCAGSGGIDAGASEVFAAA